MEQRKVCGQEGEVGNNEEVKIENQPPQIQTECQELGKADTFGHCFIKQEDEDDKHTETTEALNRIKSEPNYVDWDPEYKNILEMEIENNKLDMEMHSQEFISKDDSDKNIDTIAGIDSSRIKSEYSSIDNFNQCGTSENEDLKFQLSGMKPEVDMDTEEFEAGEITEEFAIKSEDETSTDATSNIPSNSMAQSKIPRNQRQGPSKRNDRKLYSCYNCNYTTFTKRNLVRHLKVHDKQKSRREWPNLCVHCNATFKNRTNLDDHIVKQHPDFSASVTSEVFQCARCVYKTTIKHNFNRHMTIHSTYAPNKRARTCIHCGESLINKASLKEHLITKHPDDKSVHTGINCVHCSKSFKKRIALDDHIVKRHPTLISSVTSKIHECTKCVYKTTLKNHLQRHELLHYEAGEKPIHFEDAEKLSQCIHCNATFKNKISLANHVVEQHPDSVTSVTNILYDCTICGFKTAGKASLNRHIMLVHPEIPVTLDQPIMCIHCNLTFSKKASLDSHVVQKHPEFASSVTNKLYKCTECTYQSTLRANFNRHLLTHFIPQKGTTCIYCGASFKYRKQMVNHIVKEHPDFKSVQTVIKCKHCDNTFNDETTLDDHTAKSHPDFVRSVDKNTYECTKCSFKTTFEKTFKRHSASAHGLTNIKLNQCLHCSMSFAKKGALDSHVVKKHPEFADTIANKLYKCAECAYQTALSGNFNRHLLKHFVPQTGKTCVYCDANFENKKSLVNHIVKEHPDHKPVHSVIKCKHCDNTFQYKTTLDDHIVKSHPDFITSVDRQIYECTECSYKTTFKKTFRRHYALKHGISIKLNKCIHCTKSFKNEVSMDDHIVRKHPDFIASVDRKIYECTKCNYKTIVKSNFELHASTHPGNDVTHIFRKCIHCNALFKTNRALDDHIVKSHPNFISSVRRKIYECTKCNYRTIVKNNFDTHASKHSEDDSNYYVCKCINCRATFKSKRALDDHIVKNHPNFVSLIHRKIYECTKCAYKTTYKKNLDRHILMHSGSD